jgi:hypothetical protein
LRAFRSEDYGGFGFAFAAPVYTAGGEWLGVLVAMIDASSSFERMPTSLPGESSASLLGPRDHERYNQDEPLPQGLSFLVHPLLDRRREVALPSEQAKAIRGALGPGIEPGGQLALRYGVSYQVADYADAVQGGSARYLATFAPVGNTGYVFLLQSPAGEEFGAKLWHEPLWRATCLLLPVAIVAMALSLRRRAA